MGARENDLKFLVSNIISIDQYTAKMNEDNIVLAFMCKENEAAQELKQFLEKYFFDMTEDIETSDITANGSYYPVFVELKRNHNSPTTIVEIVTIANYLCANEEWFITSFNINETLKFDEEVIRKYIRLEPLKK